MDEQWISEWKVRLNERMDRWIIFLCTVMVMARNNVPLWFRQKHELKSDPSLTGNQTWVQCPLIAPLYHCPLSYTIPPAPDRLVPSKTPFS